MTEETLEYTVGEHTFEARLSFDETISGPRPAVLVAHAWAGLGESELGWAKELAAAGYVGAAIDLYGKGVRGGERAANEALMMPLINDRDELLARLSAALECVRAHPQVDGARVAAIGFCFGGLCVLDMARGGLDLRGVVSVHGLFFPRPTPPTDVVAKVLVLHGYDDPMAKPEAMVGFAKEMSDAGVDWEINAYGGTMHAFTNREANDPSFGTVYSERADLRARAAMSRFLTDVLTP